MKIIEQHSEIEFNTIEIDSAKYTRDYTIQILFKDGNEQFVSFESFLKKSQNPAINKYLDEKKFLKFKIIDGNLNWNDYDLIFPIWDLYNGKIA